MLSALRPDGFTTFFGTKPNPAEVNGVVESPPAPAVEEAATKGQGTAPPAAPSPEPSPSADGPPAYDSTPPAPETPTASPAPAPVPDANNATVAGVGAYLYSISGRFLGLDSPVAAEKEVAVETVSEVAGEGACGTGDVVAASQEVVDEPVTAAESAAKEERDVAPSAGGGNVTEEEEEEGEETGAAANSKPSLFVWVVTCCSPQGSRAKAT